MSEFHGARLFSKTDLHWGYLHTPLEEDSPEITAFVSHEGVYRFRRVPFGLSTAPSAFQRIMRQLLASLEGVVVFLDDVVHGRTEEELDFWLDLTLQQ